MNDTTSPMIAPGIALHPVEHHRDDAAGWRPAPRARRFATPRATRYDNIPKIPTPRARAPPWRSCDSAACVAAAPRRSRRAPRPASSSASPGSIPRNPHLHHRVAAARGGSNEQVVVRRHVLCGWHVHRLPVAAEPLVLHIADDADNRKRRARRASATLQLSADRRAIRRVVPCPRAAHDHHRRAGSGVRVGKDTTSRSGMPAAAKKVGLTDA